MKKADWALVGLAAAAVFFSAGYFSGRAAGGDVNVTVEARPEKAQLPAAQEVAGTEDETGLININSASAAELMALPGVGEVLAGRIVEYRNAHGAFEFKEEIMNVRGVGETLFDDIEKLITI